MRVHRHAFVLETKGEVQAIDITANVETAIRDSGLRRESRACSRRAARARS